MTRTEGRRGPDLGHQELQINGRKNFFLPAVLVFNFNSPQLAEGSLSWFLPLDGHVKVRIGSVKVRIGSVKVRIGSVKVGIGSVKVRSVGVMVMHGRILHPPLDPLPSSGGEKLRTTDSPQLAAGEASHREVARGAGKSKSYKKTRADRKSYIRTNIYGRVCFVAIYPLAEVIVLNDMKAPMATDYLPFIAER